MSWGNISAEQASQAAKWLWMILGLVWLVLSFGMKRSKKLETPWKMAEHLVPVFIGFWLLFGNKSTVLNMRLVRESSAVLWAGVMLTALGVGISVWARLSLGTNWSGMVVLKKDHELVRKGLYRWIRHPIYTGILLGVIGTAMIKAHARGWVGFGIVWIAFYFKARREEKFLRQEFGEGFEEHLRQTGMFLPKWTAGN